MVCLVAKAGPVEELLRRVLPDGGDAARFECAVTGGDGEAFTISCDGTTVRVAGTTTIAATAGINWFLQHYAGVNISWNSPTGHLPQMLPVVQEERHTASVDYRYYLNFCTHSYSMAYWDWARWEQEIDWMALHGVNLPLVITGMECVWKDVLQRGYGYEGMDGVNAFVAGSAYYGWFFMNNLTAWGGPLPASWYAKREELARRVFARMTELGMQPVVPGYVGMIPRDFLRRAAASNTAAWSENDIVDGGMWNAFERPAFVNDTVRLKEFAAQYYAAFDRLFGDVCQPLHWAIDPFHEGGVPRGVSSAQASIRAMYDALTAYDPQAVWVCQHWQDNPASELTRTIPPGRLLILDLHGDNQGDTVCSGNHTAADGTPHRWVWGQVSNFGGNVGMFGRVDRLISCFYAARDGKAANALAGIGALPEGIENNAMLYELLYALPWTECDLTRDAWAVDYVRMRYGVSLADADYTPLLSTWKRLLGGIYNCPDDRQQGTTESVFLMRPALRPGVVSSWANSSWYWDITELRTALREMLSAADALRDNDNYRYDLVDLTRQVLADYGKQLLDSIAASSGAERTATANRFLALILDQDRLLGTRAEFRLGRWTAMARAWGDTEEERAHYERSSRMLLTTWGGRAQCETGGLHDYANREWQGMLASYYYPRWKAFFRSGYQSQNWFAEFEWPFACAEAGSNVNYLPEAAPYALDTFAATPEGDAVAIALELFGKYFGGR